MLSSKKTWALSLQGLSLASRMDSGRVGVYVGLQGIPKALNPIGSWTPPRSLKRPRNPEARKPETYILDPLPSSSTATTTTTPSGRLPLQLQQVEAVPLVKPVTVELQANLARVVFESHALQFVPEVQRPSDIVRSYTRWLHCSWNASSNIGAMFFSWNRSLHRPQPYPAKP